tara:strand:+ start:301 stop:1518 length:1218 start_codon:yes stop_codon:yes gene_type:complete
MSYVFFEWTEFLVRWFHVITGIAWIGSSFYFIALDLSLRNSGQIPKEAHGEAWQVHGGGFYRIIKYLVAPSKMPNELTWFKWEAYGTWISGFLLLAIVYYLSAELYMIDMEKFDISQTDAILISIFGIILGWIIYDQICKYTVNQNLNILALFILLVFTFFSWFFFQVFSYRGAFIQIGSMLGTIMVANVLMIIIPGQKKVVNSLLKGEKPDPKHGVTAKQRSLHNNYLTLPVIFIMISNHYPVIYATKFSWIIISLIIIVGALIRHYFNIKHTGKKPPYWIWLPISIIILLSIYITELGKPKLLNDEKMSATIINQIPKNLILASEEIIISKCSMCHAKEPLWENLHIPPKMVILETKEDIIKHIDGIYSQVVASYAMPPGNVTFIESSERQTLNSLYKKIKEL